MAQAHTQSPAQAPTRSLTHALAQTQGETGLQYTAMMSLRAAGVCLALAGLPAMSFAPVAHAEETKAQSGVGAKIENFGKKVGRGADKVVKKTTKALKHAGKKTSEGLDKAGNKTAGALKSATGR